MPLKQNRRTSLLVKRSLALPTQVYNARIVWKRSLLRNGVVMPYWKYKKYVKYRKRRKWLPYEQHKLRMYKIAYNKQMHYNVNKYYAELLKKHKSTHVYRKYRYYWRKPEVKKNKKKIKYITKLWVYAYKSLLYQLKKNKVNKKKVAIIRQQYNKLCLILQKVAKTSVLLSKRSKNVTLLRSMRSIKLQGTLYNKYKKWIHSIRTEKNNKQSKRKKIRNKKKIGKKFKHYMRKRKRREDVQTRVKNRYVSLKMKDIAVQLFLATPSFFSNLYYYCTKVKTVMNVCLFWCANAFIINNIKERKNTVFINLFFFRNVYFSELKQGLSVYERRNERLLQKLVFSQRTLRSKNEADINKLCMLKFFLNFMYLDFLYIFLSKFKTMDSFLSDTFFIMLFDNVPSKSMSMWIKKLVNKQSVRISFINFLNGYSIKEEKQSISRIIFVLQNTSHHSSMFFMFWVLKRYTILNINMRLNTILQKTFIYILYKYKLNSESNKLSDKFILFLLKLFALNKVMLLFTASKIMHEVRKYVCTSLVFNVQIENFRISNAARNFFLQIFRIRVFDMLKLLFIYAVKFFTYQIEYTLFSYTKAQYFFFARYYYQAIPPITNARLLCNYIIIKLALGCNIKEVYDSIYTWQKYWTNKIALNYLEYKASSSLDMGDYLYPVKGIRIMCSGPSYKARRTTTNKYHMWVSDEYLTGKMPLSTMHLQIEYVQSYVVLRRSNIGIKVWLLFEEVLNLQKC
jgi:hypothetical protein